MVGLIIKSAIRFFRRELYEETAKCRRQFLLPIFRHEIHPRSIFLINFLSPQNNSK
jgi:hypothetical protein